FQAEDGIRDKLVTGVQTCALPILVCPRFRHIVPPGPPDELPPSKCGPLPTPSQLLCARESACCIYRQSAGLGPVAPKILQARGRSEERRVGKECRWRVGW